MPDQNEISNNSKSSGKIFYFEPEDPRVFIPKRVKGTGWRLNFARPGAYVVLLLIGVAIYFGAELCQALFK